MSILPFQAGDSVHWHDADARVVEVRGERVALTRQTDGMTVITTNEILHQHQARWMTTVVHAPLAYHVEPPADVAQ
jgi:hypothetical protein